MTRRVAVVTVGRSDYGIYFPVLQLLQREDFLKTQLIVAAAHLCPRSGYTVQEIEKDGFPIAARVPMTKNGDSRQDVAHAIGLGVQEFTAAYGQLQPDILLLLGDRYEMFAAAIAALPSRIPVAHIHGGELTLGAIDDSIRHSITKLSHLHFAATSEYARRIKQLGEEQWRIHVTGSPVLDSILSLEPIPQADLEAETGIQLGQTLLITYHPATLEDNLTEHVSDLLTAVSGSGFNLLFTYSNADAHSREVMRSVQQFVDQNPNARLVSNLGHRKYHNVQRYVAAMVGNSSSGIIEAASFRLPVVNIGRRQAGRVRPGNVIDVDNSREGIAKGIRRAVSPEFRQSIANVVNPYGDGRAAERIVSVLRSVDTGPTLIKKKFVDYRLE
jgi:GDP/UDP-N,N'-diacetylbacillosamine 2-epimerase (hydrolysing)